MLSPHIGSPILSAVSVQTAAYPHSFGSSTILLQSTPKDHSPQPPQFGARRPTPSSALSLLLAKIVSAKLFNLLVSLMFPDQVTRVVITRAIRWIPEHQIPHDLFNRIISFFLLCFINSFQRLVAIFRIVIAAIKVAGFLLCAHSYTYFTSASQTILLSINANVQFLCKSKSYFWTMRFNTNRPRPRLHHHPSQPIRSPASFYQVVPSSSLAVSHADS